MRIEQLEYLCEVAKRKSMNKASQKLHIAQQTLSTSIKNLESELGAKLLDRTYQGVFPTAIGQEVIEWGEDVLSGLDALKFKIAALQKITLAGTLTIGTDRGINMLLMPKVVSHFHTFHPDVHLSILEQNRQEIEAALRNKTLDIGLIVHHDHLSPDFSQNSDLIYVEILAYSFFARVSTKNPLAEESTISIRSLLNYPIALYKNTTTTYDALLPYFQQYGAMTLWPTFNPFVATQLVSDNQAVSISVKTNHFLPPVFNDYNGTIATIPLKEQLPFFTSYCLHRDNLGNPNIDCFIDALTKMT